MMSAEVRVLSDGEIVTTENITSVITVRLSLEDIAAVKLNSDFGTSPINTYLSVDAGALLDVALNSNAEIANIMVTEVEADTIVSFTSLVDYTLDLNTGVMSLTFSDVVNVSTQYSAAIRLQSRRTSAASETYTLSSNSISDSNNGHVINITLSDIDLLGINSISNLAKSLINTYLIMRADYIDDYLGNDVLPITDGKALRVSSFIPDSTAPQLLEAILDFNLEALNLTFSDVLSFTTLDLSMIALQNEKNLTNNTISLALTDTNASLSVDARTLTILLTVAQMHELRTLNNFGTDGFDTFVTLFSGAIEDFAGNGAIEYNESDAFPLSGTEADVTGPILERFGPGSQLWTS